MEGFWLVAVLAGLVGTIHSQVARRFQPRMSSPPLPQCREKVADVYFILDSSSSIFIEDFERERQFFREVVKRFDISPVSTRVGASVFSDNHQQAFGLNQNSNKRDLLNSINTHNLPYLRGNSNTHEPIRYVRTNGHFRRNITNVIVIITDGYSRQPVSTAAEADSARREGFYLYVIGVGQYIDERELRFIASNPVESFIFNITNYRRLDRLSSELPNRICQLPPSIVEENLNGRTALPT